MKIFTVCPESFAANTYLLISDNKAIVVDPAVSVSAIERKLAENNAELCGILLTHGHFDHTVSVDTLRDKYSIPLMIHSADAPMLTDGMINGFYDFYGMPSTHRPADKLLSDGDVISVGDEAIRIISTPGHSPGSICILCKDDQEKSFLITGDTLFADSIGRCDLWGGSDEMIRQSLRTLKDIGENMTIYAGHGPSGKLLYALRAAEYYIDF